MQNPTWRPTTWPAARAGARCGNKASCTLAKSSNWNTKKAFEVLAHANAMYWTATSTFHVGACGVESAADDCGYSRSDVVAAFNAFGDLPVSNKANA